MPGPEHKAAAATKRKLMQQDDHIINSETAPVQAGALILGSQLNYHHASIQLAADCCRSRDATLIISASSFLTFESLVEGLQCGRHDSIKSETRRFVHSAYWAFLRWVFLASTVGAAPVISRLHSRDAHCTGFRQRRSDACIHHVAAITLPAA